MSNSRHAGQVYFKIAMNAVQCHMSQCQILRALPKPPNNVTHTR